MPASTNDTDEVIETTPSSSKLTYRDRVALTLNQEKTGTQSDRNSVFSKFVKEMLSGDHLNFKATDYWKNVSCEFEFLQHLALTNLAIPASSAASERVFSQCDIATKDRRNRTQFKLLNLKLIIHLNKKML